MCIICTDDYDETLTKLDCSNCRYITKIPKILINLTSLDCHNCKGIYILPLQLTNLRVLTCSSTNISRIPTGYTNLQYLKCDNTHIKTLPKTFTQLKYLYCYDMPELKKIPKEYTELLRVIYFRTGVKKLPDTLTKLIKNDNKEKLTEFHNISGPKNIQDPNKPYYTSCFICKRYYSNKDQDCCNTCKK